MFKRNFIVGVLVCLALFSVNAQAQLPQIDTGLSYLTSAQSVDGNWDSDTTQVETTAATATVWNR